MRPLTVRHTDIKSSSGKSVVSAYDYTMRQGKYRKYRRDVLISDHGHLPEWSHDDPRFFWQCVEGFSTRKNAVLKRGAIVSLPTELKKNPANLKEVVEHIVKKVFLQEKRCPYSYAVHDHGKNLHLHLDFHETIEDGIARSPDTFFQARQQGSPGKRRRAKSPLLSR